MFSYEEIQKYNETDICIYKYIVSNIDKVQYMTIRELAKAIHISTSTILRFCNKNNFEGYSDFKEALKKEIVLQNTYPPMEELQELSDFFARGTLAKYGARYFANMGHFAVGLEDTLYPITTFQWKNTVVIALSESGETDRLIEAIHQFKQKQCTILSITNSSASTLAKMSDWNFSYHLSTKRINGGYNGTTQIPVIFIVEALAKRI